jgi:osmotically-inducible protein OsmY
MGIVTRTEADAVVNASRTVKGVQRVVKLFEYMN